MAGRKEVLIIDCQIFQTFSWQRGMGKYSIELLRSVLTHDVLQETDIKLLFNQNSDQNDEAEAILRQIAPTAEFVNLGLLTPKEPREEYSIEPIRHKNKRILDKYIEQSFSKTTPLSFLILSLYLDEVCSVFPSTDYVGDKLLLYYDSIPYLYHERYGAFKNFFDHYYLPHTATVFEATKILTISRTVANDLRLYFGVEAERIYPIDGASIPRSTRVAKRPAGWKYAPGSFILMPTGQELRKNNRRAVQAFERFTAKTGDDCTLIITSHFSEEGRSELRGITDRVDFSGSVSEGELLWLYQNCRFVLFPSEYEGLGLPVLEAVDEDKLVACSDIPVFRELSMEAFYFFNPKDVDSITDVLVTANEAAKLGSVRAEAYKKITDTYTWGRTAELFAAAFIASPELPTVKKKKIAVFSPDPSGFSAIGKDIGELHSWYSNYFEVDYYFDKGPNHRSLRPNILKYASNCYSAADFNEEDAGRYDALVYHIGNSEYHLNIIRAALAFPGYMILHDTDLSGAFHNMLEDGYINEQRYALEQRLDKNLSRRKNANRSTLITSLVNGQRAVICHSRYAKLAVDAKVVKKGIEVRMLELPFDVPPYAELLHDNSKKQLSIAFAGIIAKIKGIDVMEKIAMSEEFADCQINIFGLSAVDTDQLKKLRQLPNVHLATNVSDFEFQQLLINSDVMVNVRLAYRGETSGSTLSHMRYGGVGIVRDFGWFSELPDDVVVKVNSPEEAIDALRRLVKQPSIVDETRRRALDFMKSHHSHRVYAESMYKLIGGSMK